MIEDSLEGFFEKYKNMAGRKYLPAPNKSREDDKKPVKKEKEELLLPEIIKSEVNFLVLPFFALSTKGLKKKTEIEYKTVVKRGKEKLEIVWNVSSNPKYGYPGPFDKEVHKAIEWIISRKKLPIENPVCIGSLYNLAKIIGIKPSKKGGYPGWIYKDIKEALERIIFTGIKSRGAFYSKGKKKWIEDAFHLYDRVVLKGEQLDNKEIADTNFLYLSSWYLQSLNARYVKPLNYHYYKQLRTPIASRLYELLGVKFFGLPKNQPYVRYKYSTLCQLLPITRQKYLSAAKQKLDPAHRELKRTEFLADYCWEKNEVITGYKELSDWYLTYYPGKQAKREMRKAKMLTQKNEENSKETGGQERQDLILQDILEITGDHHSKMFYQKVVRQVPESIIRQALSETKVAKLEGKAGNPAKYFTFLIKKISSTRGIKL